MRRKILINDLLNNRVSICIMIVFVAISAMLVASAINLLAVAAGATDKLLKTAKAPHFIQMHTGDVDQVALDNFSNNNTLVQNQQTVEMLNIDATDISFDEYERQNTIMDIGFVVPNEGFDFLFGLNGQILNPNQGEIAVPISFMQQYGLKVGEKVTVQKGNFCMKFTIIDFVRDSVMNPSIVYSKRFVVNTADFMTLKANVGESEYLVEFLLKDIGTLQQFMKDYESTELPRQGIAIDYNLLKTLNMLSDGIVAIVILLLSFLFSVISILTLKFVMTASILQDYREIGVMKALGICSRDIKRLYISKYSAAAFIACLLGYGASFIISPLFTKDISLYTGSIVKGGLLPLVGVAVIFLMVMIYANAVLSRFKQISAVVAINAQSLGTGGIKRRLSLSNCNRINVDIFTGFNDIFVNIKSYIPLFFVFVLCCFIVIVPLNLYNTVKSPDFINYMGSGKSDLRIDLRQSKDISSRFENMSMVLKTDNDISKYAVNVTSSYKVKNAEGGYDNLNIETGDLKPFPINYIEGYTPEKPNEIALSSLNAKEMSKGIGENITVLINEENINLTIVGIYQDITNGGKTSKAVLAYKHKTPLWYVVLVDFKQGTDINVKTAKYAELFHHARVTDINEYILQTFGQTLNQLESVILVAVVSSLLITILLTALFIRMLMEKDKQEIVIMKRLGFSNSHISNQYLCRSISILMVAMILGVVLSNTVGQKLAGVLFSFMGASEIQFIINPFIAYVICPAIALLVVFVTTLFCVKSVRNI